MSLLSRIRFLYLRLRHSSFQEMAYRLYQAIMMACLKYKHGSGASAYKQEKGYTDGIHPCELPQLKLDTSRWVQNGSGCNHLYQGLSVSEFQKSKGTRLPITQEAMEDDIRIAWEPARLQRAVLLMHYLEHSPNASDLQWAKNTAKDMIFDWMENNTFAQGIHYKSAMECALRVLVFCYALKLLDNLTGREQYALNQAIYHHGWLISKRLSLYSSLGNHTISEAVGLIFAGGFYKQHPEGRRWLNRGIRLLDEELTHQILDDGGPAEQSLNYHRFVLDLYWLAVDFLNRNRLDETHHQWESRLTLGESFLAAFLDKNAGMPLIGDSDDGYAIGARLSPKRGNGQYSPDRVATFKDAGYTVIRHSDVVLTFDHGPLGMPPLYNHGHADALSITLSKDGQPIIVDSGTFRYNGVPGWRNYFKGTPAHNTVTIDGQDQSVQETSFIWSKPFNAKMKYRSSEKDEIICSAEHDGYTRLKEPVWHARSVLCFDKTSFLIRDSFRGQGQHCFQLNFHLHPNAIATKEGNWWIINNGGTQVYMRLLRNDFQLVRGQYNPPLGWYSAFYGEKMPTSVLTIERSGQSSTVVFTTAIFTQKTSRIDNALDEIFKKNQVLNEEVTSNSCMRCPL